MTKIVIIGATGSVGRVTRQLFLEETNDELTLFSRRPDRLKPIDSTRVVAVSGDVMKAAELDKAISGQDVVFASLTGNLGKMAKAIVESMQRVGVKGEPFGGHDVSRKSIANLVVRLAGDPNLYVRESVGINRPE